MTSEQWTAIRAARAELMQVLESLHLCTRDFRFHPSEQTRWDLTIGATLAAEQAAAYFAAIEAALETPAKES